MKQILFLSSLIIFSLFSCDEQIQNNNNPNNTVYVTDTVFINNNVDYKVPILGYPVSTLYYECGNSILFDLPEGLNNVSIEASQAIVQNLDINPRKFTIVPSGTNCNLKCRAYESDGSVHTWERSFNVIKPPRPEIELLVNNRVYDGYSHINKKSKCIVRLKADTHFLNNMPRDARYTITKVDLLVSRSLGAPTKIASYNGNGIDASNGINIDLGNKLRTDSPGTKIYFRIEQIQRVNFQNQKINENFSSRELIIPASIK